MAADSKPGLFSRVMGAVVGSLIGVVVGAAVGIFRGAAEFAKAGGGMFVGEFAPIGLIGGAILGAAVGVGIGIFQGIRHAIEQGAKNGFAAGCAGGARGGVLWEGPKSPSDATVEPAAPQKTAASTNAAPEVRTTSPEIININKLINQAHSEIVMHKREKAANTGSTSDARLKIAEQKLSEAEKLMGTTKMKPGEESILKGNANDLRGYLDKQKPSAPKQEASPAAKAPAASQESVQEKGYESPRMK